LAASWPYGGRLDKTGATPRRLRRRGWGQTAMAGVYTDQRLNLSNRWEGPQKTCQGFKPDPGNLAVRDYRGASGNVSHGGTVNPSCNRKSRNGNPSPTAGRARFLSQWGRSPTLGASQLETGGAPILDGRRQPSLGGTSRMTRECHIRFCERLRVKLPGPTRPGGQHQGRVAIGRAT
jgi:hypothetical protein